MIQISEGAFHTFEGAHVRSIDWFRHFGQSVESHRFDPPPLHFSDPYRGGGQTCGFGAPRHLTCIFGLAAGAKKNRF